MFCMHAFHSGHSIFFGVWSGSIIDNILVIIPFRRGVRQCVCFNSYFSQPRMHLPLLRRWGGIFFFFVPFLIQLCVEKWWEIPPSPQGRGHDCFFCPTIKVTCGKKNLELDPPPYPPQRPEVVEPRRMELLGFPPVKCFFFQVLRSSGIFGVLSFSLYLEANCCWSPKLAWNPIIPWLRRVPFLANILCPLNPLTPKKICMSGKPIVTHAFGLFILKMDYSYLFVLSLSGKIIQTIYLYNKNLNLK